MEKWIDEKEASLYKLNNYQEVNSCREGTPPRWYRTTAPFSSISEDQFHEQNNKMINGEGGAIGTLDNETALFKRMVAGPEISKMLTEVGNKWGLNSDQNFGKSHHEDTQSFERKFVTHTKSMINTIKEEGNPFVGDCRLISVDSKNLIAQKGSVKMMENAYLLRLKQYEEYIEFRLNTSQQSIHDII